jgi:hypothetical protein
VVGAVEVAIRSADIGVRQVVHMNGIVEDENVVVQHQRPPAALVGSRLFKGMMLSTYFVRRRFASEKWDGFVEFGTCVANGLDSDRVSVCAWCETNRASKRRAEMRMA